MRNYLLRYREKKGYASIGEDAKEIFEWVDLVLLHLFLEIPREEGNQILYNLIDSGVDCFDKAEKLLIEKERYYVLSRLYQSRGITDKVLETWMKMIDGSWPDIDFKNGEERMRDYLIKCRDGDLVFRFGMWLAKRNPEAGVQVVLLFVKLIKGSGKRLQEKEPSASIRGNHRCIARGKCNRS